MISIAIALSGCAGTQEPAAQEPTEPPVQGQPEVLEQPDEVGKKPVETAPALDATGILESRARWIPKDVQLVAMSNVRAEADALVRRRSRDPFSKIRSFWFDLFVGELSANFGSAERYTYAVSPSSFTLIFEGEFEPPDGLESKDVDGLKVYDLGPLQHELARFLEISGSGREYYYLVILDEPAGAVLHMQRLGYSEPWERPDWPKTQTELDPGGDRYARIARMLQLADGYDLVVVSDGHQGFQKGVADTLDSFFGAEVRAQGSIVFAAGSRILLGFLGESDALSATEAEIDRSLEFFRTYASGETTLRVSAFEKSAFRRALNRALLSTYLGDVEKKSDPGALVYALPSMEDPRRLVYLASELTSMQTNLAYMETLTRIPGRRDVLKVTVPIKAGTRLQRSMLSNHIVSDQIPETLELVLVEDMEQYLGKPLARSLEAGSYLLPSDFEITK